MAPGHRTMTLSGRSGPILPLRVRTMPRWTRLSCRRSRWRTETMSASALAFALGPNLRRRRPVRPYKPTVLAHQVPHNAHLATLWMSADQRRHLTGLAIDAALKTRSTKPKLRRAAWQASRERVPLEAECRLSTSARGIAAVARSHQDAGQPGQPSRGYQQPDGDGQPEHTAAHGFHEADAGGLAE